MKSNKRRLQRGNAIVEFAVSTALLFPLLAGTFQLGYSLYAYNKLESAVKAGARYAALRTYDSSTATPSAAFTQAIQNMVVYANPNGGTTPIIPGLTTDKIVLSVAMYSGTPDMITVTVSSFQIDAVVARITLAGKPSSSYRFQGRYAPV